MVDDGTTPPTPSTEMSGYVYWGQFVDHDMTLDLTPLADAGRIPPEGRLNHRSPFFDLDSLYGDGPLNTPCLYELPTPPGVGGPLPLGNERFLLGPTHSGKLLDVPRTKAGRPPLGDSRNEENLVLAQFHVLMLQFHNKVMDALEAGHGPDVGLAGAPAFTQARRIVTWHYQYLVLNELLGKFLYPGILEEVRASYRRQLARTSNPFLIPIEFALAAYRFGHSMIRNDYNLNRTQPPVSLKDLLLRNSMGDPTLRELPDEWLIDWTLFFPALGKRGGFGNVAHALDVLVAHDLHNLPGPVPIDTGRSPRPPLVSLPAMTLLRGQRSGLPSGQSVADALGEARLSDAELVEGQGKDLRDHFTTRGFIKDTPLWFYVLQEAAVNKTYPKLRLGPVGSRIVAEVVVGSLITDPNSILNAGAGWTPPTWPDLASLPIDRISNLVLALR